MQLCLHANILFPFWLGFTRWLVVTPMHINFQNYSFGSCFCSIIQLTMRQGSRLKVLVLAYLVFLGHSSQRLCLGRPICSMYTGRWKVGKPGGRAIYLIPSCIYMLYRLILQA